MDWQVKSVSRQSDLSGSPFKPGQKIVSFLCKDERGDLLRYDVLEGERKKYSPPGVCLGWWRQVVKEKEDEAEARRQILKTAEGLFLSLYEEEAAPCEERDVLKYLLSILLERKRILKPSGKNRPGESQTFEMAKTKAVFRVPSVAVRAESLLKIEEQLKSCI